MVRKGYKQTEVGEIPGEWKVKSFSEVTNLITCGIAATPRYVTQSRGFPFLSSTNVKNGRIIWEGFKYIGESLHRQLYRNNPPLRGDVLYTRVGTIGEAAVIEETFEFSIYVSLTLIKPKPELDPYFLMQLLNSFPYRQKAREQVYLGGGVGNLNVEVVRTYPIPLPKKTEQRNIARTLGDIDELILSLEKLIAKKWDIKIATMQKLLTGKKRLSGFGEGKGYKQTEVGKIPEDWDIKSVRSFTDCTAGGTPSTLISSYWGGAIRWMSSGELHLKRVRDVEGRITKTGLSKSSTRLIPEHCVLIGLAGQGKTRGTVAVNEVELCTNQSIAAIYPSENHCTDYLFYNLESRYDELRSLSTGDGGRGGLNLTIIRSVELPFPNKDEQIAIANVLSDIDSEIASVEAKLRKTKAIKQGMMQELLTGRTRLIDTNDVEQEERMHGT